MTDLPSIEIAEGLRALKAAEIRGGFAPSVHPVGPAWRFPIEHRGVVHATCRRNLHEAPQLDCTCGFHGVPDLATLGHVVTLHADSVVLEVEFGGTVIEHEHGLRAETQEVIGARLSSACYRCGEPSQRVEAGRFWRPLCLDCAERRLARHKPVMTLAQATERLGADIAFCEFPLETRRSRLPRQLMSVGAALASLLSLVGLRWKSSNVVLAIVASALVALSFTMTGFAWGTRTSRNTGRLVVGQCWLITVLSALVVAGTRR